MLVNALSYVRPGKSPEVVKKRQKVPKIKIPNNNTRTGHDFLATSNSETCAVLISCRFLAYWKKVNDEKGENSAGGCRASADNGFLLLLLHMSL